MNAVQAYSISLLNESSLSLFAPGAASSTPDGWVGACVCVCGGVEEVGVGVEVEDVEAFRGGGGEASGAWSDTGLLSLRLLVLQCDASEPR